MKAKLRNLTKRIRLMIGIKLKKNLIKIGEIIIKKKKKLNKGSIRKKNRLESGREKTETTNIRIKIMRVTLLTTKMIPTVEVVDVVEEVSKVIKRIFMMKQVMRSVIQDNGKTLKKIALKSSLSMKN